MSQTIAASPQTPPQAKESARGNPLVRLWQRISPSLVPPLAVLSAMIFTIPFMVITGAQGDVGRGLNIAFTAYSALIEGSLGIAINDTLTPQTPALVLQLVESAAEDGAPLTATDLRRFGQDMTAILRVGADNVLAYDATIKAYSDRLTPEQLDALGARVPTMQTLGAARLESMRPLYSALGSVESAADVIKQYAALETLSDDDRAALDALVSGIPAEMSNGELLANFKALNTLGTLRTAERVYEQYDILIGLGLQVTSAEAGQFAAIAALAQSGTGAEVVQKLAAVENRIIAAGITDEATLANQLLLVESMYNEDVITNTDDVQAALTQELPAYLETNFAAYRPGNQPLLLNPATRDAFGVVREDANRTPDNPDDDRIETVYAQFGGKAFLFFPANLERTLTRMIPFVIAGLAVALGFKAGLFNIGAEGQLYIGSLLAVWVGFSPAFDFLPGVWRLAAVLVAGVIGGGLWGMIPGALKAYTGAHEVINTIMLNFIAIKFAEWMIRAKDPYILRDPNASVDQTPNIAASAIIPRFTEVSVWVYVLLAVLVAAIGLYARRRAIAKDSRMAIRPIVWGALTLVIALAATWHNVRGSLHIGFLVMIGVVVLVGWYLKRTTGGFALQTVGSNPDAARYAGMNVKLQILLGLTFAGALAGLAGAIEIAGTQYNMKPGFFSGLGFDAIAVALLARSTPRNMIASGFLWGALVTGAGLMQVRADIAIDLVKIIQALIIMFIAADLIVRWLWRVPKDSEGSKAIFAKGWGG
jgi:simple sugar transport system permease protein